MRFYQMTLNGKILFYFCVKNHKKIDFGKLFTITNEYTNSWGDFEPHKLLMKQFNPSEDNEINWIEI